MAVFFLIGFPGSGKSTLGRALAQAGAALFVDLDKAVEADAAMSVSEIFAREGEQGFRSREARILTTVAAEARSSGATVAVACGGGTPCRHQAMDLMLSAGTVVWLDASADRLRQRLRDGRATRPLIARLSDAELDLYIDRVSAERAPAYARAHRRFDASFLDSPAEIARSVEAFIHQFITPCTPPRKNSPSTP